jgi:tubulin-folding cofactor B
MSLQTPADIPVIITAASTAGADAEPSFHTERRVTPSWTVLQLKSKLETMTGIPPGSQRLRLKAPGWPDQWIQGDADRAVGDWGLVKGCEIEVCIHVCCMLFVVSVFRPSSV